MDGEGPVRNAVTAFRQTGALNDSELDREIAAALNVDPSPEFLARVRMRVAREPAPADRSLRWLVLAGAAAALVVIAVVTLWPAADRAEPQRAALPDVGLPPDYQTPAPAPLPDRPLEVPTRRTPGAVPSRALLARAEETRTPTDVALAGERQIELPPFPEVLVSAEEVRAYRQLLGIVDQQRLPPPSAHTRAETGAVDLPDIDLASLRIEALPPMARLEGVRQ